MKRQPPKLKLKKGSPTKMRVGKKLNKLSKSSLQLQQQEQITDSQSDDEVDMLDMVEDGDLAYLKQAVDSKSYDLFSQVQFTTKGKKPKKRKEKDTGGDDDTLENKYEENAENIPKKKFKALLPIKTKSGIIQQMVEQKQIDAEGAADRATPSVDTEKDQEQQLSDSDSNNEDGEYILKSSQIDVSEPVTTAQLVVARSKVLDERKVQIGSLCSLLLENPVEHITNLQFLIKMLDETTAEVYVTSHKLVIMAVLEVFKDLLPAYQIKQQSIEGVKVKKDTLKLHKFEENLLQYYKKYLQKLEKFAQVLYKKHGPGPTQTYSAADLSVGQVALQAMVDLLIAHPYFNFAQNLAQALVPYLNNRDKNVRQIVAEGMKTLFKEDKREEITLKVLRVLNHYLKSHSHNVNTDMLEILLFLRIKDVNLDQEKALEIKNKKLSSYKQNVIVKLSKKERKRKKRLQEIEQEMLETKAEENKQLKAKNLTEITKIVFGIYFRILKSSTNTKVLGICLEGLAKFSHCINLEFYVDIVNVLDKLLSEDWLGLKEKLHCIQTVFAILGGQGEALNLDPTRFYIKLYSGMLDITAATNYANFSVLLHTLTIALLQRRKKITNSRIVGFVKRLATLSLQLFHNGALSCLAIIKTVMQLCKSVDILLDLDSELGDGKYNPHLDDPEYSHASSSALYELVPLSRHYHPVVGKYAMHIASGVPTSGEGSLPAQYGKCSPEELFKDFDMSEMAFNPPVAIPRKAKIKRPSNMHIFADEKFKEICHSQISLHKPIDTFFMTT